MRKHQQRQILELLRTIREAQSASLYADCQDGALVVGEFIEEIRGEGTKTVALLEEYCELVFKAHSGEIGERALNKHLVQIENSVKSELKPDRVEMVFLSYKASMSDSIESIYLAAKEDPFCDAYWIPILYYNRKADGSLGEMQYEGAEFYGENIECTDWREYDIEERRPDVIFTFNPYDAGNYVTSVHPDYYCERLRGLTDMLVYVPYFVAGYDIPDYFCTVAGCIFAHKVIVQSEKVRETYIRSFKKQYSGMFGRPEDKFIALGSPKFDKVINTKREDCALPDEWRELINGKKVVFYNTVVTAMLKGGEQYLQNLRATLERYRTMDGVALWWRPHPLGETTLASMRPELVEEYKQIVKEYRREGWGIYDETPDLHRAIAWSDVYYGDWSSLVAMFAVADKPVTIQQPEASAEPCRQDRLMFECSYDDGDYVWFAAYFWNALFKMDKRTWVAEYIGAFPGEPEHAWKLYTDVAECGGKLYFAPCGAARIVIYDMAAGLFDTVDLKEPDKAEFPRYDKTCKFANAVRNGQYVYFIPGMYPAIVRFDTEGGEIEYMTDWIEPLEKIRNEDTWYFCGKTVVDDKVYVSVRCANAVLLIDGLSFELKPFDAGDVNYCGVCHDGSDFLLVPCRVVQGFPALIKWNENTGRTSVLYLDSKSDSAELEGKVAIVIGILHQDGCIWVFPDYMKRSLKINAATGDIQCADAFRKECEIAAQPVIYRTYTKYWEKNGVLYALGARSGAITRYDTVTGKIVVETMTEDCHAIISEGLNTVNQGTAGEEIYFAIAR